MKINLKFAFQPHTGLVVRTQVKVGVDTLGTVQNVYKKAYEIGSSIIPRAEIIPPFDSLPIYTEDKP